MWVKVFELVLYSDPSTRNLSLKIRTECIDIMKNDKNFEWYLETDNEKCYLHRIAILEKFIKVSILN